MPEFSSNQLNDVCSLFQCPPYKVVPPNVINWFINPMNTIDISPTKTIVKLELFAPTERYRLGAPPCNIHPWPHSPGHGRFVRGSILHRSRAGQAHRASAGVDLPSAEVSGHRWMVPLFLNVCWSVKRMNTSYVCWCINHCNPHKLDGWMVPPFLNLPIKMGMVGIPDKTILMTWGW